MNSPLFDDMTALFPPYLVPTIDKYLRADIGCTITSRRLEFPRTRCICVDGDLLTYHATPEGINIYDAEGFVALLRVSVVTGSCNEGVMEVVALCRTCYVVITRLHVILVDVQRDTVHLLSVRAGDATLCACRLDASTFVIGRGHLSMFSYEDGQVIARRHWPLKMQHVAVDRLAAVTPSCFIAVRANLLESYDTSSMPGIRSIILPNRPHQVVAGQKFLLIAIKSRVCVYNHQLWPLNSMDIQRPITALAELADGCIAVGCEGELTVWKRGELYHTYRLDFTPLWMAVPDRALVSSDGHALFTFVKDC
jgi:hypothetical protein